MDGITRLCFGASYGVALAAEFAMLVRPASVVRTLGLIFGAAGLLAHTLYLLVQRPTLAMPYGSLLLLAWVLAVFYLYGSVHHRRLAWAVFVLPLVLALVILAGWFQPLNSTDGWAWLSGERFWGIVHGTLVLSAAVGVCVGAVASAMYLLQARRLRAKTAPADGLKLLSLERLEAMNRRAINAAFPLLTAGVVVGASLGIDSAGGVGPWLAPKVVGTAGLWLANAVLLVLRYSVHARGRLLAVGTLGAFALMMVTLLAAHPFVGSTGP